MLSPLLFWPWILVLAPCTHETRKGEQDHNWGIVAINNTKTPSTTQETMHRSKTRGGWEWDGLFTFRWCQFVTTQDHCRLTLDARNALCAHAICTKKPMKGEQDCTKKGIIIMVTTMQQHKHTNKKTKGGFAGLTHL
jgi:hypothetical protein